MQHRPKQSGQQRELNLWQQLAMWLTDGLNACTHVCSKNGGAPPQDKDGGTPPCNQNGGAPPVCSRTVPESLSGEAHEYGGAPPVLQYGGAPPLAHEYGGAPPVEYGGAPPVSQYGGAPP
eukprot:3834064-Lingulodinium_polyedra.AAC.1